MAKKAIDKKSKEKEFKKLDSGKPSVDVLSMIWNIVGVLVGLAIAYHHTWYLYIQHENEMWFTNIKQVEREISFRRGFRFLKTSFLETFQIMIQLVELNQVCTTRTSNSMSKPLISRQPCIGTLATTKLSFRMKSTFLSDLISTKNSFSALSTKLSSRSLFQLFGTHTKVQ
jgi:hypothetical protein